MKEKEIQQQILEGLKYYGQHKVVAWRNNVGAAVYRNSAGANRFVKFGITGQSDITGICMGRRLDIEVKQPGGKSTPAQIQYGKTMTSNGGIYYVAESLDEAMSKLHYEIRYMQKTGWAQLVEDYFKHGE